MTWLPVQAAVSSAACCLPCTETTVLSLRLPRERAKAPFSHPESSAEAPRGLCPGEMHAAMPSISPLSPYNHKDISYLYGLEWDEVAQFLLITMTAPTRYDHGERPKPSRGQAGRCVWSCSSTSSHHLDFPCISPYMAIIHGPLPLIHAVARLVLTLPRAASGVNTMDAPRTSLGTLLSVGSTYDDTIYAVWSPDVPTGILCLSQA